MEVILPLVKTELHEQLEVLVRRYSGNDRTFDQLNSDFGKEEAGFYGERQLDYYLHLSDLNEVYSLAGLRLKWDRHYFQIDRLLLGASVCFAIEVKHLKGKLFFNEKEQLIQQLHDHDFIYDNPYTQVKLQAKQLRHVFDQAGYSDLPIHPLVVFTHKNATLNFGDTPDILALQQLTFRIDELLKRYPPIRGKSDVRKLAQILKNQHTVKRENVLRRYHIDLSKVRRGVFCPGCERGIMNRVHGTWLCRSCKRKDCHAHVSALTDYRTLFGGLITNKQARWFLGVESRNTIYRLFTDLGLPAIGNNRATRYDLSKLLL